MPKLGLTFLLVAIWIVPAPGALAGQRGGGRGRGQMRPVPPPATSPTPPSMNQPSFPLEGLNRPSFQINRPFGIDPPAPSPFAAGPTTYAPGFSFPQPRGRRSIGIPGSYGFGPAYGGTTYGSTTRRNRRTAAAPEPEIVNGTLLLDVTPRTALVFIDTAYVGTVDDLFSTGLTLLRGRHWLELEATEYEKKLIEINITPGQPLRYRADLTPVRRAALTVIPSRPPETMYAIPGCYGGNKPPVAATLPPGCDIAKVRVLRPQQRPN
jgi:hypothetical protein